MSNDQLVQFYSDLSSRKKDVLYWVANGLTNPQIARKLYISSQGVADHLTDIYIDFGIFSGADETITRFQIIRYFVHFFEENPHLCRD